MAFGHKRGLWPERRTSLGNARASLLIMIASSEDGQAFGITFAAAAVHGLRPYPGFPNHELGGGSKW